MRPLILLWLLLSGGFAGFALLDRLFPPPLGGVALSRVVLDRNETPLRVFPVDDGRWRLAADKEAIDPRFIAALIAVEDQRFRSHGGVDAVALVRALRDNIARGEIVSGAPTITMQTVRLLEPRPRTIPSKIIEMWRARQLEYHLSKDEILELYLTLAPYGGNLQGLRTATLAYFGKDPASLTDSEIAILLALPQSPEARRPDLRPSAARASRNTMLRTMTEKGLISAQRAEDGFDDALPTRRPFPSRAWHFAATVSGPADPRNVLQTTIDPALQAATERIARETAVAAGPHVQVSAIVLKLDDRSVVASVGSAERNRPGGWIDLTRRPRSPGSTLKPLIYGLAFEEGIAGPNTLVADVPSRFGTYEPQNFGRDFSGELTLSVALQHSLNVPAVLLLDELGPERLVGLLELAGVDAKLPARQSTGSGLAVALGGIGLSAEALAVIYAALGDGGTLKPIARTPSEAEANLRAPGQRLLGGEAAAQVLDILRSSPSVKGRLPAALSAGAPRIAFKTGTSYGYRDAWAAGVSDDHAVVVWIGRPDGGIRAGVTGREAALPVLFELFDQIEPRAGQSLAAKLDPARPSHRVLGPERDPVIIFPPDETVLWPRGTGAGFLLAGRGSSDLYWYVNGQTIPADDEGNVLWTPPSPGFYRIKAVDRDGRKSVSRVRVRSTEG